MTAPASSPTFDGSAVLRRLVRNVTLTIVTCAVVIAALIFLAGRADWWSGFLAATIASVLAAAASMVPLSIGLKRGYLGLIGGFMGASAVRFVVGLGLAAFAVGVGGYPKVPTFILVMPYYLATLAVESYSLTRLQTRN